MISVVHIGGDNIGSPIQVGSPGAHQVTTVEGLDLGKLREFVAEYEARAEDLDLPGDDAAQLRADIVTVKAQIESPRPNRQTIRTHLMSVHGLLDNAAGSAIGGGAVAVLLQMLQHVRF